MALVLYKRRVASISHEMSKEETRLRSVFNVCESTEKVQKTKNLKGTCLSCNACRCDYSRDSSSIVDVKNVESHDCIR